MINPRHREVTGIFFLRGTQMPYVKRDAQGKVVAVSRLAGEGFDEELPAGAAELDELLGSQPASSSLEASDQDLVRVLEDVVDLLIAKGVILFTELPASAQQKILHRQRLRSSLGSSLDLLGDD